MREPWAAFISWASDNWLFTTTFIDLPERKDLKIAQTFPDTP